MANELKPQAISGGSGVPPEPEWSATYNDVLDVTAAHDEWGVVVREMQDVGTLCVANGHAIERLIHFRLLFRGAMQYVAEHGAVLKGKRTRAQRYNPQWGVLRQSAEQITALEAELGISPVRRGKAAPVQKKVRVARAADAYLKPVSA